MTSVTASGMSSGTMTTSSTKLLFVDIETYSEADLKTCGVYRYVDDPSFEVMLFGYAYGDDPVEVVDFASGESLPKQVLTDMADPHVRKIAHNANFERTCLTKWLGVYMDPMQWDCTAIRASTLGLPRSLADVGEALGLKEDEKKMAIGKRLVQYFAKPCAPTKTNGGRRRNLPSHEPGKWALYKEYNRQDVVTERVIYHAMEKAPQTTQAEKELWALDQKINETGVLIDEELVDNILEYSAKRESALKTKAKELSGMENPSSFQQIRKWLKTKGIDPDSLDKEAVKALIKQYSGREPDVVEFLQIRQELGKTSVAKYDAMARAKCSDGRIRGMLQFYGANRTGRWAGRIVQLQNLPQNKLRDLDLAHRIVKAGDFELLELLYESPMDVFSQLIRTSFIARKGHTFAVADYSAIEARVIAWLAGEEWRLHVFNTHGKIYEASASQMFHVPIEQITKDSPLRKKGKVAELALGYQGSVGAMKKMGGEDMGLTKGEMQDIVDVWRRSNPKIVGLWQTFEAAAKKAISHPGVSIPVRLGIVFKQIGGSLYVRLPSGRAIAYYGARLERVAMRTSIKYMGQNQQTQKWEEVDTYGGKITENITQAVARDCLGAAMLRLDRAGYGIRFHVHDEVIIEVDQESAESDMAEIREIMRLTDVDWREGLPLKADGYLTEYYKKD